MSKFKDGDRVRVLPRLEGQVDQSPYYMNRMAEFAGTESVVQEIRRDTGFIELDGLSGRWHEDWLELADKPFTQEDLEIGMLIEYKYGDIYGVNSESSARIARKAEDVVVIYKPTETGFERAWTKPEPKLYTLELPNNNSINRFYNRYVDEHYRFSIDVERNGYQTQFTQEEIDNLPNQDLIEALIKKEVVE